MKNQYVYHAGIRHPIKSWTRGVQIEDQAMDQLINLSSLPFIHSHIAAMPDVHWGRGATVGSVIATKGAIVPAAVGVDIGCGMLASKLDIKASELPDSMSHVRSAIEAAVPHGRTDNGGMNDKGGWTIETAPKSVSDAWMTVVEKYTQIEYKHPKIHSKNNWNHMGTLGTGNHFIEVCLDESGNVWVMLHSGSRGPGNRIGTYFIEKARKEMERWFIGDYLPDRDLSYLVENTELFDDYMEAVHWAQQFAQENRYLMMHLTLTAINKALGREPSVIEMAVNCHHNYVARESHHGQNVWVTRKGAVRAREGDLGIIPGSMGTGSFIVRGKGNPESFCSCSHGAGRSMSRGEARKTITLEQHRKAMVDIEARLDEGVLDESPAAYKPIEDVMSAQQDLVEVVHELHQIVNVKG